MWPGYKGIWPLAFLESCMEPYIIGPLRWKNLCLETKWRKFWQVHDFVKWSKIRHSVVDWLHFQGIQSCKPWRPWHHHDHWCLLVRMGCMSWWHDHRGVWNPDEATHDINYLEILAVLFALQSFSDKVSAKHIKLMVHNTTAVATINQMGTCHSNLNNKLVQQIWEWCILHEVWLTIAHIPGKTNAEADRESRLSGKETEWCLDRSIYNAVIQKLDVIPDIDLFASRLNHQLKPYIAYRPDPGALAVNAFHISWKEDTSYAFPPFCIIQRVLQKINIDQATGIIIIPNWPTQTWWPYLMSMLINYPIILPRKTRTLFLPAQPEEIHPLHKKLELLACHLTGTSCLTKEFQKKLQNSSSNPGGQGHRNSIELTLKDGNYSVLQGKLIPFVVLYQMALIFRSHNINSVP